jgi:hypothetical protein
MFFYFNTGFESFIAVVCGAIRTAKVNLAGSDLSILLARTIKPPTIYTILLTALECFCYITEPFDGRCLSFIIFFKVLVVLFSMSL